MPAPDLILTPGATDANSFASVDEYKTYWNSRLFNTKQLAASDDQIKAALLWTGRLFNKVFVWTGNPSSPVQAMSWPRKGMVTSNGSPIPENVNPSDLKDAQCEWAGQLIVSDLTATNSIVQQGISSLRAGPVAISYKANTRGNPYDDANVDILRQQPELAYLAKVVPDAVRYILTPSWYVRDTMKPTITLEAVR